MVGHALENKVIQLRNEATRLRLLLAAIVRMNGGVMDVSDMDMAVTDGALTVAYEPQTRQTRLTFVASDPEQN